MLSAGRIRATQDRTAWEELKAAASLLVDAAEREYMRDDPTPIDSHIRPLVVCLTAFGLETTGSCEGHELESGRMTHTYVVLTIKATQRQLWQTITASLLFDMPMPVGSRIGVERSGARHPSGTYRFVLFIEYPHQRDDNREIQQAAIRSLVSWLDKLAPLWLAAQ